MMFLFIFTIMQKSETFNDLFLKKCPIFFQTWGAKLFANLRKPPLPYKKPRCAPGADFEFLVFSKVFSITIHKDKAG